MGEVGEYGVACCRVVVSGRVHGVGFRDSCRREAVRHGVAGWVRNRLDGSVEAVLEGDEDDVEAVIVWCRSGPSQAVVTAVAVEAALPEGRRGFQVLVD